MSVALCLVSLVSVGACQRPAAETPAAAEAHQVSLMRTSRGLRIAWTGLLFLSAVAWQQCTAKRTSAPTTAATLAAPSLNSSLWLNVERGAYLLAESTNLLKIPRRMVPTDDEGKPPSTGRSRAGAGADSTKIEKDRALWYKHADGLKTAALEAVMVASARRR